MDARLDRRRMLGLLGAGTALSVLPLGALRASTGEPLRDLRWNKARATASWTGRAVPTLAVERGIDDIQITIMQDANLLELTSMATLNGTVSGRMGRSGLQRLRQTRCLQHRRAGDRRGRGGAHRQ